MSQSTVWTQLSSPNSPAGSVPFVDNDNVTIKTDVLNFKYTPDDLTTNLTGSFRPKQLTVDGGFRICYDDTSAVVTPTLITINKPAGRFVIPAGQNTIRINNTYCAPGCIILFQIESNDSTLDFVFPVIGNNSFVVNANAAATANCRISFVIFNTF